MRVKAIQSNVSEQARRVSSSLRGLAHEKRLAILVSLQAGEQHVNALVHAIGCSQSALSQHLAIMRQHGIVESRRDGNQIYYRVRDQRIYQLLESVREIFL